MTETNIEPTQGNVFDRYVRAMFSNVAVFVSFLVYYGNPKFVSQLDLSKISLAPTHYFSKNAKEQILDLLFLCPFKNGSGNASVVIVFEHAQNSLFYLPLKLLKYTVGLLDWLVSQSKKEERLPATYMIVLRTGSKATESPPTWSDMTVDVTEYGIKPMFPDFEYDFIDLPKMDFADITGDAVLRTIMGILYKMGKGLDEEFPEALLPAAEIVDEEQKKEIVRQALIFIANVIIRHGKRMEPEKVEGALHPIFYGKEHKMMLTIFEEAELKGYKRGMAEGVAEGVAAGEARGKASAVLAVLRARFRRVPAGIEKAVRGISDPIALDSWAEHAATCESLQEFEKAIN